MGILKKDFKYKIVKNFLTPEEVKLGAYYLLLFHKKNLNSFDFDQNNNGDTMTYADTFSESVMMMKLDKMEKETGLKLFPTYSFSRVYTFNAELVPHKDRPSCEISVTVMWGSDGTKWPIYMEDTPCELEPGDAVIYLGCELNHYRKPFTGDWHAQSFLHYVDQNGPYKDFKYDKRNFQHDPIIIHD